MRCSANVFLSFIFLGILSTFADACVLNGPRYQLASDTVRWSLKLSGGETCIRGVRFNNVVVDKLAVVSAPQTGHVTLQGPGFSYKAARDFQGSDFFSLMVSGATNKVPGSSTIEVEVSVIRADELRRFSTMISPSSQSQPSPPSLAGSPTSSPPLPPPVNDLCGSSNDVAASSAPDYQSLQHRHGLGRQRQRAVALALHQQQWPRGSTVLSPRANFAIGAKAWA